MSLVIGLASRVDWPDGRSVPDHNGFVTALGVRELRRAGREVPGSWLDVLVSCRRPDGAFGFWPADEVPEWAPALPTDSDDTAVMLLELTLAGRVDRADARRTACHHVAAYRLPRPRTPGPPWLRRGMVTTWHRAGRPGIVDLTAVTNALALLHALDLGDVPGVAQSLDGLAAGVAWAGSDRARWRSLTPFYPEPDELARALDHAADWRVPGAADVAASVRAACPREDPDAVCSMAYGPPVWHSPTLAAIRTCPEPGIV